MQKTCRWICLSGAALVGAAAALAVPTTNADTVMRQIGLKVGQWHTIIRITAAEAVPATQGGEVSPRLQGELRRKVGTFYETDDCVATRAGSNGNLILPGINIGGECPLSNVRATKSNLRVDAVCGSASSGFQARTSVQAVIAGAAMNAHVQISTFSREAGVTTHLTLSTASNYTGPCRLR